MAGKDSYLLGRRVFSSIRLTAQHLLWHDHLGWNLHPTISQYLNSAHSLPESNGDVQQNPTNGEFEPLRVADIACGNTIWLAQESKSSAYPTNTQFYGFDISPAQFPFASNLTENVHLEILDASHSSKIPDKYHSYFDVIHLRLIIGAVVSPKPTNFLESFLTMLKPGGYLQWDEADPYASQAISHLNPAAVPKDCKWDGWIPRTVAKLRPQLNMPMSYPGALAELFAEGGLIDIQDIRGGLPVPEMRKYWHDNEFGVMTEIFTAFGADADIIKEIDEGHNGEEWELAYELRICVGRKPQ
jgi:hypothetical protein